MATVPVVLEVEEVAATAQAAQVKVEGVEMAQVDVERAGAIREPIQTAALPHRSEAAPMAPLLAPSLLA